MTDFKGVNKGDRVRMVFEVTAVMVGGDGQYLRTEENVYYAYEEEGELVSVEILKPPLPTEDGWYESEHFPLDKGGTPYILRGGKWSAAGGGGRGNEYMQHTVAPLYRLGRVSSGA